MTTPEERLATVFNPDPEPRYAELAEMRSECPVHRIGEAGRYVAVDHDAVATGLKSVNDCGGSAGQAGLPEEDTIIAGLLEPRHGQIRRIINSVVAFHKSQKMEPFLEDLAAGLVDDCISAAAADPDGVVEVMRGFVEPIPPATIYRLFGFDIDEAKEAFVHSGDAGAKIAAAVREGRSLSLRDAAPPLAEWVDEQIAARQAMPRDDWPNDALTRFLVTDVDGEVLTPRAITTQIIFSVGAGSDTTRNTLGSLLYRLAQDPETYARIRADRDLVETAVEEALRLDSPAQFMVRQCLTEGFELGGEEMSEGDTVVLSIAAANRDGDVFDDPDSFDIDREGLRDHLAFGTGPHICPGAALARLEMRVALNAWCDRVESFSLAPDYTFEPVSTAMLHGPQTLRLAITPAEA